MSFPNLGQKWALSSLAAFINDPLKVRSDGRMPRTAMEVADAADIAAYLLQYESSEGKTAPGVEAFSPDKALAERGRAIVAAMRCGACHQLPAEVAVQPVALKPGSSLELWAVPPQGAPRSLGLISASGLTVIRRDKLPKALLDSRNTAALAVSVEPPGGSPTGAPTCGTGPISAPVIME